MGKLDTYLRKRDFSKTAEPKGGKASLEGRRFVIQKHAASSLHYDFRLEIEGVLVSWAVPKGPSLDTAEKRLAMRTEDHPMDYGGFEGTIPEGQYGGGSVIVWDAGLYRNLRDVPMDEALAEGKLSIWVEGEKIRGGFNLIRTRTAPREKWFLAKKQDEHAGGEDPTLDGRSVLTGRTVEDLEPA